MRVLHITNNYPTFKYPIYGIFVYEQIKSLEAVGIKNEVFFINGKEKGKLAYIKSILLLRKKFKSQKFDIIHCHHAFSALVLLFSGIFFNTKCVVSYQNDPDKEGGVFLFKIFRLLFDRIILKSNSKYISHRKCIYLPNGVNTNFFYKRNKKDCIKKLGLSSKYKYVLFMDSNSESRIQKRLDRFNEVIKILRDEYGINNIEPLVLTNTKRELIPCYFSVSKLYLLTSDFEGSPNVVKESLACDTPVVSTKVGNVEDMIGDVAGSYVVDSFDPYKLAEKVNIVLNGNEVPSRKHIFEKGFDIESVAKKLYNIYLNETLE